jgi:hypothetical protein
MTRLLFALVVCAAATSAFAVPSPPVPPPPPVVITSTASIALRTEAAGIRTLATVDLSAGEVVERDPVKPATVLARRKLGATEVAALRKAWSGVLNAELVEPSSGPSSGGSSQYYEVVDKNGASKLVALRNGVAKGKHYIEIDAATDAALRKAWPKVTVPAAQR